MSRGLSPPSCSALQIAALSPVGTVRYRVALTPYLPLVSPFSAGNSLGMLLVPQCLWELRIWNWGYSSVYGQSATLGFGTSSMDDISLVQAKRDAARWCCPAQSR